MDDDDRLPKKYTLVYGANGKLYAVAKDDWKKIEEIPTPVPPDVAGQVRDKLNKVQDDVQDLLMGPLGSGVRVRVPDILD